MTVLGMRRSSTPCEFVDEMFGLDNLREMLARSDYVVVTTPLTEHTRGMLGKAEFRAMKPGAYFIVTSRGGVADTGALQQALEKGWIAGAGLDAHEVEPVPPNSPFWSIPGVFVSPHCSSSGTAQAARGAEIFVDNLRRYTAGKPLNNVVDLGLGY